MKPAVSNIAWPAADDEAALEMLQAATVRHIEIAPTRHWPDLAQVDESAARSVAEKWHARGFSICAFQALLFGKPELQVFGPDGGRACLEYLGSVCRLAGWMGAKALVFGSPKSRLRGDLPLNVSLAKAVDFFRVLGGAAMKNGVIVCIEPNPSAYGCDFIQTANEAAALVERVNSPGIKMNLDMGELIMNGAIAGRAVEELLMYAGHFHVSEPMLQPFDPKREAHLQAASALKKASYQGVVSLEMKTPQGGLPVVNEALRNMLRVYFADS
jgi:D-psicose/D-tagatose/L-ribulose 3-epimerase